MREITDHKVNDVNDGLTVKAVDEPGAGGACHDYVVYGPDGSGVDVDIQFQNGPIKEVGVNGLTHEVLLAIVIDRLRAFQAGPYACKENSEALAACVHALGVLKMRTEKRQARGVEGTHQA